MLHLDKRSRDKAGISACNGGTIQNIPKDKAYGHTLMAVAPVNSADWMHADPGE